MNFHFCVWINRFDISDEFVDFILRNPFTEQDSDDFIVFRDQCID